MKLLYCPYCQDVVKLHRSERACSCGRSNGRYLDDINAIHNGYGIPFGISNYSFLKAIREQPETGQGKEFLAFVIPKTCDTFAKR